MRYPASFFYVKKMENSQYSPYAIDLYNDYFTRECAIGNYASVLSIACQVVMSIENAQLGKHRLNESYWKKLAKYYWTLEPGEQTSLLEVLDKNYPQYMVLDLLSTYKVPVIESAVIKTPVRVMTALV